jgi:signal transduction histidine kinase
VSSAADSGQADGARRQTPVRLTILVKLLAAFAVPTLALFVLFAVVAHEVARRDLDAELGTRLAAVAASAATQIRGKYLEPLLPGDEDDRAYQNTVRRLEAVAEVTGVARIFVFDREFRSKADIDPAVPIGAHYFEAELDRHELGRVFSEGAAVSSVLFQGEGGALQKAGYAPIRASEDEPEIVLALGVSAPATYFERLAALRRTLLLYGALLVLVVLAISVAVATLITRPVRRLATAAERIGKGDLAAPVAPTSRDEIGLLAETMEQMRADLAARDARAQQMLSGIAHEVRNPLGGIELYAGILRDELPDGDERRRHVERIDRELGYLKAVVTEFLDYARRSAPELAEVDLRAAAAEVVELFEAEASAAGVALELAPGEDPVRCLADEGQVHRVLLNLVRNALQASEGGGTVRLAIARGGGRARVAVHNRGAPIPEDVRARVFEPFYTTREKGTGLGLAFVREIIADHGGAVTVASSAEDGTTFTIELPEKG